MRLAFATATGLTGFGPMLFAGQLCSAIHSAEDLGYDGIELSVRSPAELEGVALPELLGRHHLTLAAVASGRAYVDDGLCLTDPSDTRREAAIRRTCKLIEIAAPFSAPLIIGLLRGAKPVGGDAAKTLDVMAQSLDRCAAYAEQMGGEIVLEAINRYETSMLCTAADVLALVERVGRPNLNVLLDTFHMNIEEVSPAAAILATGKNLRHFHVADSNRHAPGQGHIDFPAIAEALKGIDYDGWVSAEILPLPDDRKAAERAIVHMRASGFAGARSTTSGRAS